MDKATFLEAIKGQVKRVSGKRGSKVEKKLIAVVKECMENRVPTTINTLCEKLGKGKNYGPYIRTLVKKSSVLELVKINGISIVVTK